MDPFDQSSPGSQNNMFQNLMNFGASTMANSAPANAVTGASAIGRGMLGGQQMAMQNSQARSANQLSGAQAGVYGAEAATKNIGNQMSVMSMNMLRRHYGMAPLMLGANGQLTVATDPSSTSGKTDEPRESQGMTGPSWSATPGSTRLNSGPQTNSYAAGSTEDSRPITPFSDRIMGAESGGRDYDKNGNPLTSSKGAKYAMQVMPETARDPGFGVEPAKNDSPEEFNRVGREYAAAMQERYGGDERLAAGAYNAGPGRVDQALAQLPQETQDYVPRVVSSQPSQAAPQGQSDDPYSTPKGVNPAAWDQALMLHMAGNPYGTEALKAMASAPYTNIEARQGGITYNPGLGITAVGRLEGESPGGAKYLTPPNISGPGGLSISGESPKGVAGAGGGYAGVPPGSFLTDIGPGAKTQIEDLMKFHSDGEHGELKSYHAAVQATQNVDILANHLESLNQQGGDAFLKSGSGGQWRNDFAKGLNTFAGLVGAEAAFNPEQVASAEGAYKMTNLLGMQMISQQFGAGREAGNIIMTGIKSNPSIENTPEGAKMLVNGIREVNNNTIDRYSFKDWWARPDGPHPGDLRNADVAFNKVFPSTSYAQRAISQEQPVRVNTPGGRAALLPGTIYVAPDGSQRQVPDFTNEQLMEKYTQAEKIGLTPVMQRR